ncbi:hypothetical protein EVAR_63895_1 [Eumeta japonica]|uniref:Uncharacterized protein n=1 Tax=Eumeta variegata TaxID=151549 RepID=A0A4C1ZNS0_EUMVA|nr:hypothetical protein EVAR_63895_1 [Eumeta japonica]
MFPVLFEFPMQLIDKTSCPYGEPDRHIDIGIEKRVESATGYGKLKDRQPSRREPSLQRRNFFSNASKEALTGVFRIRKKKYLLSQHEGIRVGRLYSFISRAPVALFGYIAIRRRSRRGGRAGTAAPQHPAPPPSGPVPVLAPAAGPRRAPARPATHRPRSLPAA